MKKLFFSLLFYLLISLTAVSPVYSQEEILILFDSSLSMGESISDEPKFMIAADAVKEYLSKTNNNTKIGFRIIGLQLSAELLKFIQNPDLLCKGTKLLNPIQTNNVENIKLNLENIMPLGVSPLTYSIKTSIENDFSPDANPKHIILITDGAESCDQDPCSYVRELSKTRKDVKVDIIAIDVNTGDLHQLKCISDALGGNVYNIKTAQEMNSAMNNLKYGYSKNSSDNKIPKSNVVYKNYLIESFK